MSGELIELTGARAPRAPIAAHAPASATDQLLRCDAGTIELAIAPEFYVSDLAWLYQIGPSVRLIFASVERPLGDDKDEPMRPVMAKVVMPLASIERMHAKLGAFLAAAATEAKP
jgi:hypothetical protein